VKSFYTSTVRLNFIKHYLKSPHPVLLAALQSNERYILLPTGEGAKVLNIKMLAPFGGKWRISAERGHKIHVSIMNVKIISMIET